MLFTTEIVSLLSPKHANGFTWRPRVAIFTCYQTAQLHFTGLVMVFKSISEASNVTISMVTCLRIFSESNICIEFARK